MTIQQQAAALRVRECSSLELTRESLDRIGRLDPGLNAFITVTADAALARARQMDEELSSGRDRGPFHGIPVAVKDMYETRGVRTTCGSRILSHHVPDRDAAVVERLEAAGAVIVGKTNMHELAYGVTSVNPHFGTVRNPWDRHRMAGGSSGGSAVAVVAGMVPLAMGSDTGGSIRIPASFCGAVGLKPAFGRVSCHGILPLDHTLGHMGPITASVRDAALALEAVAGYDPRDPFSSRRPVPPFVPEAEVSIAGLRLGVLEAALGPATVEAAEALRRMAKVAEELGARLESVPLAQIPGLNDAGRTILLGEAAAILEPYRNRREDFGSDVLALLDQGWQLPATAYIQAQLLRRRLAREFHDVWRQADCLLLPVTPTTAPEPAQTTLATGGTTVDLRLATTYFTRPFNVLGLPALSLPAGLDGQGLPLAVQIVGKPFDEKTVLRLAAALEDATRFTRLAPPLP